MKVFLYESLEDADSENQIFSSIFGSVWSQPMEITTGDANGKFWLPYLAELQLYQATVVVADIPKTEIYLPEDN